MFLILLYLMYLPKEIHECILEYVLPEDKVYASLTCKWWAKILEDMFLKKYTNNKNIPNNCAYDLNLYFQHYKVPINKILTVHNFTEAISNDLRKLYDQFSIEMNYRSHYHNAYLIDDSDINNVNVLAYRFSYSNINVNFISLLHYYCRIDAIHAVNYLLSKTHYYSSMYYDHLLQVSFHHKSFNVSKHLLIKGAQVENWFSKIDFNLITNVQYNNIIGILEFLIKNNMINLPHILDKLVAGENRTFPFKDKLVDFIKGKLDKDMIDFVYEYV